MHQLKLVISLLPRGCIQYKGGSSQSPAICTPEVGVMLFQMIGCACPFHDAVYQVCGC